MQSPPRRKAEILFDDRRPVFDRDFFERHFVPPAADKVGLTVCPRILDPFAIP
jgi:hypothetical protein